MRFLHLADLHLGKMMNDWSLLEDQEAVLLQILEMTEREKTDAVLIAGDVYQRSSPQAEAMTLFDSFISGLAERGQKVFIISGNHDSAQRISYFSHLIRNAGIHVTEAFRGELQHVAVKDADGEIVIWMMPFLRPSQVRRWMPEEKITTYQEAVEAILRRNPVDPSRRNILICHQYIAGCEISDSEELSVGGLDQIEARIFGDFDYVALGHIHKPQKVGRDTMRYAGSPLKYSFSEAGYPKSVPLVDMGEKGDVRVRLLPLYPRREVRQVEGLMEELTAMPYTEDYVWVTVHDELPPPDARITLSVNFPNMMKYSIVNSRTKEDIDVLATEAMENKSITELFSDFYRLQNRDQLPGEEHMRTLEKALKEMEEK